jgi:hypothetical protein
MKLFSTSAIVAVTVMLSLASANAQWGGQGFDSNSYYSQNGRNGYRHDRNVGWGNGWDGGWQSRNVSDPSFGNRRALHDARRTGRCVADLGYGRYEYCGW